MNKPDQIIYKREYTSGTGTYLFAYRIKCLNCTRVDDCDENRTFDHIKACTYFSEINQPDYNSELKLNKEDRTLI